MSRNAKEMTKKIVAALDEKTNEMLMKNARNKQKKFEL